MRKLALLLALPLLAFAAMSTEGVVVTTLHTDLATGETSTSTMSVVGESFVMEFSDPASGSSGSIVFLSEGGGELIMNDDENEQFVRVSRQTLEQISEQLAGVTSQIEQMMAGLPEAQREAILNAGGIPGMPDMSAMSRPKAEVVPMGETVNQFGYTTQGFEMKLGDRTVQEMWVADWSDVPFSGQLRSAFEGFASMMASFLEAVPFDMFGDGGPMGFMDFERGVPIVTYEVNESGERTSESAVQSFTQEDVDMSKFGPKPNYTEQTLDMNMN